MPNDKEFELDDLESFSFDDLSLEEDPPASESSPGEDPFGVWVKSAPVDLDEVGNLPPSLDQEPEMTLEPEPVPEPTAGEPPLMEDDFLSSEELANLDESFDFVTIEDPLEGETPLEDEVAFLNSPEALEAERSAPPAFDEISLDDFVSFDEVPGSPAPGDEGALASEVPVEDEDFNTDFLDIDIDIEDDIKDEELEILEGAPPRVDDTEDVSLDDFSAEEVDLSEFGDFEEVTPLGEGPQPAPATPVVPEPEPPRDPEPLPDLDLLPDLDSLPELTLGEPEAPPSTEVADLEEFPDLGGLPEPTLDSAFLTEDDGLFEEEVLEDSTDLDHILALEEDLTKGLRDSPAEEAPATPQPDLAALIMEKLEKELSSIKQEIILLKEEMTSIKGNPGPVSDPADLPGEPVPREEVSESVETVDLGEDLPGPKPKESPSSPRGFFDDEDDETIALTGDELDNLLSTAEISEGEEPGMTLDEEPLAAAIPVDPDTEEVHVSDEEFLSGTALDLNDPVNGSEDGELGVPDSIELEEGLPLGLEGETDDLLSQDQGMVLDDPASEDPLPIPFDEEVGLELSDFPTLEDSDELKAEFDEPEEPSPSPVFQAPSRADPPAPSPLPPVSAPLATGELTPVLKDELRAVLSYMDKLLASLPDDKIQEFAESEHFEVYKRLFEELGLIE